MEAEDDAYGLGPDGPGLGRGPPEGWPEFGPDAAPGQAP
jgi:hypothetical protein